MPTIHYAPNSNASEVDIRTGVMLPMFLFRFWTKTEHPEKKEVIATNFKQAKELLVEDLIFAARLRQDDYCRATGVVVNHQQYKY